MLARAGDGKALFVQQSLDAQNVFNIFAPIHALASAALDWLELRKLGFPKSQHVGRQPAKTGDFADTKVELFGNQDFGGGSRYGLYARAHSSEPTGLPEICYTGF